MKAIYFSIIVILFTPLIKAQTVQLDPTFGNGGILISSIDDYDYPYNVATQSTGKVIVLVSSYPGFSLIRYNYDGSIDDNFGTGGVVNIDFTGIVNFGGSSLQKLLIQANDQIVVAGNVSNWENDLGEDFAIVRLNSDGSLDPTFGTGGKVVINLESDYDDLGIDIILSKDGGYILSGLQSIEFETSDMCITKLDNNGNIDKSFGNNGFVVTPILNSFAISNMVVEQTDGKIISGGQLIDINLYLPYFGMVRYDNKGKLDLDFGSDGIALTNVTDPIVFSYNPKTLLQSGGNIIVPGLTARIEIDSFLYLGAIGFNPKGKINGAFGEVGFVILENEKIDSIFESDILFTPAVLQPDDKIVIAFKKKNYINLYRLNKDGSLDTGFGNNGIFTFDFEFPIQKTDIGSLYWSASDNKLLYCATLDGPGFSDIGIARIDVNYKTATDEVKTNIKQVNVYPNPGSEMIELRAEILKNGNAFYNIKNIEGKIIKVKELGELNKGTLQLPVMIGDLVPGLYIFTLQIANETQSTKFIKE